MDVAIPNVTQRLQFTEDNYVPVFSGTYSSVHKGTLHNQMVRDRLYSER
jgi:hypothetical protein